MLEPRLFIVLKSAGKDEPTGRLKETSRAHALYQSSIAFCDPRRMKLSASFVSC